MRQILTAAQAIGDEFDTTGNLAFGSIILSGHAGGTWTLQVQDPDDTWIDTDITWTSDGIKSGLGFARSLKYRLNGGSVGAKAWVSEFA